MNTQFLLRAASIALCAGASLAIVACGTGRGGSGGTAKLTDQGWTQRQQSDWYEGTQGSRLMPYSWYVALEQAGNDQPFNADDHMAGFRFLPRTDSKGRRLPVGFTIDNNDATKLWKTNLQWFSGQPKNEHWLGLNCSACHTAELAYKGTPIRIDGGQSLVDFQAFVEAVDAALNATLNDPVKWERFATAVLKGKDNAANRTMLKKALGDLVAWQKAASDLNDAKTLRHGFGRLDAFGHIFNKVALFSQAEEPAPARTDAPVSYPFLWDIYRHDFLQYDGIASNTRQSLTGGKYIDVGALGRNVGEVFGVFGDVKVLPKQTLLEGYPSSVWANSLVGLEVTLSKLKSPPWPTATMGAIDQAKADAGQAIYQQRCLTCHIMEPPGTDQFKVNFQPLVPGNINFTDPWMACNAVNYATSSGLLQGVKGPKNTVVGATAPGAVLLPVLVTGALKGKKLQIVEAALEIFLGVNPRPRVVGAVLDEDGQREADLKACFAANSGLMRYKARPLDGIWATAPYLHNGSVPTLYDLLLPAAQRPKKFLLGTREYDPVKVGYVTGNSPGNSFVYEAVNDAGKQVPGNSNMGHDYGVGSLSEDQRLSLLEYLKTL